MTTLSPDDTWRAPPDNLTLADDVHVWRVSLRQPAERRRRLRPLLTAEERDRADRFYFERDRHGYVVTRGLLRVLLGRYLDREPAALTFAYAEHGKPYLPATPALQFNVSHAGNRALFAFARAAAVGVDLEQMRPLDDALRIAESFFSEHEKGVLRALPAAQRPAAFLHCWTRKEAYIKAVGDGLTMPLRNFDVTLAPGEPARLLATRPDAVDAGRWTLRDLSPGPDYIGALVVAGADRRVFCWQVPAAWPPGRGE